MTRYFRVTSKTAVQFVRVMQGTKGRIISVVRSYGAGYSPQTASATFAKEFPAYENKVFASVTSSSFQKIFKRSA